MLLGVPIQGKGLKALRSQIQHPAQLSLLLPGIVTPQAAADPALPISRVAAQGTGRLFLQAVLRQAQLVQEALPLPLKAQILPPQAGDLPCGVHAPAEGGGDQPPHGGAQLHLNLPQARAAPENTLPPLPVPLLPRPAVLLKSLKGLAHNFSVVGHLATSPGAVLIRRPPDR